MPKRNNQAHRKGSYTEGHHKAKYQEKQLKQEWKCGVCDQHYTHKQDYCQNCFQSLFYYCYVNNHMFVTKDDSYLSIYYHQQATEDTDVSEGDISSSEQSQEDVSFEWVQSLLM